MSAVNDGFGDLLTGMAFGAKGTRYHALAVTADPQEYLNLYRGDWIARKIVDIPAFDMVREGRAWQAEDAEIEKLEAQEARLQYWPKVSKALKLARLLGGAVLIMGVKGSDPALPLDPGTITEGALTYLHVMHRYEISTGEIERDPASPWFGGPKEYRIISGAQQITVHPSRVVRLIGADVPEIYIGDGWGDSVLQAVSDAIRHVGLTTQGVAALIVEAKVDVFKVPKLSESLQTASGTANITKRFQYARQAKSLDLGLLMDAEEEWETRQISFSGLPDVLATYLQIVAGAADIPATRLLGQAPQGMNSTGDGDYRNYMDRIASEQELMLRPALERLDEVLIRSALGSRPPEVHFTFNPLWQLSETERAVIRKSDAETAKIYSDTGLVPDAALASAVQNQLVESGTYPGLEAALAESDATIGLSTARLDAMLKLNQAGKLPDEDLFEKLKAGGLTTAATVDEWRDRIEVDGSFDETDEDVDPVTGKSVTADPAEL